MIRFPHFRFTTHAELPDAGQVPHCDLDLRHPALWRHITHLTLPAASHTITLAYLPTGFELWRLHVYAISDDAGEKDTWSLTINDDTGNNYDAILLSEGAGSSSIQRAGANLPIGLAEGAASRANTAAPATLELHRPTLTTHEKTGRFESMAFGDRSADGDLHRLHGLFAWRSTAAIHKLTLTMTNGDFATGSHVALWGLRLA